MLLLTSHVRLQSLDLLVSLGHFPGSLLFDLLDITFCLSNLIFSLGFGLLVGALRSSKLLFSLLFSLLQFMLSCAFYRGFLRLKFLVSSVNFLGRMPLSLLDIIL